MHSAWNDSEAAACGEDVLLLRVYTSQLLGLEPSLVLHGGGNTSVKARVRNIVGDEEDILYIKGSGWDLATIKAGGFAPTRLHTLQKLADLAALSDSDMMRELKAACTHPAAPTPSVEAILHAIMPLRFVDHTHADAVVAISNTPDGETVLRELYGDEVLILPYVMPGFVLAQQVRQATANVDWKKLKGIILLHHGVFTFADDARTSYENMIALVDTAERYLQTQAVWSNAKKSSCQVVDENYREVAALRKQLSTLAGKPMLVQWDISDEAVGYSALDHIQCVATRGPLTPDHVLHTKRTAMVIDGDIPAALQDFSTAYATYFERNGTDHLTCLDTAPRVGVWRNRGMLYAAFNEKRLRIVRDIATHTRRAVQWAEALGGWQALPEKDIFDLEYWELEQAKLKSPTAAPWLEGKVALVTGAASGIGRACVELLQQQGACVLALDINPAVSSLFSAASVQGVLCDVTNAQQRMAAIHTAIQQWGGIDLVISNAGNFPASVLLENLDEAVLHKSLDLNFSAHALLLRDCLPFLREGVAPAVVVVASKNVPAPGPGALAYSSAKAALTQMVRVTALEWGRYGIRINAVHPNAVFDTAIWDEKTLQARAAAYGLSVQDYKTANVLKREVTSAQVAQTILALCSDNFACTTGAQVPVDGGNERVI